MVPVTIVEDIRPLIAFVAPLVGVLGIAWAWRKKTKFKETFTFLVAIIQATAVVSMVPIILSGKLLNSDLANFYKCSSAFKGGWICILRCVASLLWIATTLYAIGYMRGLHEHAQTRFYSFFAISLSATMGVAFSANLLTIYFFYEMLASTFPLKSTCKIKRHYKEPIWDIFIYSLCLLLPAMSWCYVWPTVEILPWTFCGHRKGAC